MLTTNGTSCLIDKRPMEKFRLTFELPGLPRMANGSHGHWSTRYRAARKWTTAAIAAIGARRPATPLAKIRVIFTRFSSVEPDDDGLTHGFKPIRDALVRAGIVMDDKRRNMEATYLWFHAPRGKGKVTVEIEEVTDG